MSHRTYYTKKPRTVRDRPPARISKRMFYLNGGLSDSRQFRRADAKGAWR